MKVDDLSPRDFWHTAQEDMELCTAIQQAVRRGEERADTEARKAREAERDKAKHAAASDEMLKGLRAQG